MPPQAKYWQSWLSGNYHRSNSWANLSIYSVCMARGPSCCRMRRQQLTPRKWVTCWCNWLPWFYLKHQASWFSHYQQDPQDAIWNGWLFQLIQSWTYSEYKLCKLSEICLNFHSTLWQLKFSLSHPRKVSWELPLRLWLRVGSILWREPLP